GYGIIYPSPEEESLSLQVTWARPSYREDGSPLDPEEISSYVISYSHEDFTADIYVHGAENTSYLIQGLVPGRYSVTVSVVDVHGIFSAPSGAFTIDI
ncbi:MAG: fibronectin type III domain-containing protein, partial [Ketobacteraceae bacterium]|nr:fibronectin type III domain-containing protein [Ketobacteraceae bacterium]